MSFCGKAVLITGASSGIGAETAVRFACLGASLAITGRQNKENLQKVAERIVKNGCEKPVCVMGDLSKEEDVKNVFDESIKHLGKLDVLVNNAGYGAGKSIEEADLTRFDSVFNTNVRAVYYLTSLAVPYLIKTKGSIINLSSVASIRAFPNFLEYCMSKAAIDQFTRCIALELAPKGVRVNSVNPGVIITGFHKRIGYTVEQYNAYLEKCKGTHAMGRVGCPDEVAKAIVFLAGEGASFTTGVQFSVDGGKHLMCPR